MNGQDGDRAVKEEVDIVVGGVAGDVLDCVAGSFHLLLHVLAVLIPVPQILGEHDHTDQTAAGRGSLGG